MYVYVLNFILYWWYLQSKILCFPAHFRHLFIQFRQIFIHIRFFVNQITKFSIQIRQLSLKFVCVAKRVRNVGSNSSFFRTNSLFCHSNSSSVIGPLHLGDEFDWNFDENECEIDEIVFAISCSAILWPTNLNCSWRKRVTKHEIERQCFKIDRLKTKLKRAFAHSSVWDEIENTFSKIEWRDDENGRENLY